jgi:hypothetical protein
MLQAEVQSIFSKDIVKIEKYEKVVNRENG